MAPSTLSLDLKNQNEFLKEVILAEQRNDVYSLSSNIQLLDNCSTIFVPSTEQYLQLISTSAIVLIILAGITTAITCAIYMEEVVFMSQNLLHWKPRSHAMWLLGIYPVYSVTALMGLLIPRTFSLDETVATLYLSISVYYFSRMLIEHYGGKDKMSLRLADESVDLASPPLCCCCSCLPKIRIRKTTLHVLEFMVMQFAFVRPLVNYITAMVSMNSGPSYLGGSLSTSSMVYSVGSFITSISTIIAIYGNTLLYKASSDHLAKVNIRPKFFCMQAVMMIDNVQKLIFYFLVNINFIRCSPPLDAQLEAKRLHYHLLVFEMLVLSCIARVYYRRTMERMAPEDKRVIDRRTMSTMTELSSLEMSTFEGHTGDNEESPVEFVNNTYEIMENSREIKDAVANLDNVTVQETDQLNPPT